MDHCISTHDASLPEDDLCLAGLMEHGFVEQEEFSNSRSHEEQGGEDQPASPFSELFSKELLMGTSLHADFALISPESFESHHQNSAALHVQDNRIKEESTTTALQCLTAVNTTAAAGVSSSSKSMKFSCGICSYNTSFYHKLMQHRRCHWGEKNFSCTAEGCTAKFTRLYYLKRHMRSKHVCESASKKNNKEASSARRCCPHPGCSFTSQNERGMILHRKSHLIKRYFCKQCNLQFSQRRSILTHLNVTHENNIEFFGENVQPKMTLLSETSRPSCASPQSVLTTNDLSSPSSSCSRRKYACNSIDSATGSFQSPKHMPASEDPQSNFSAMASSSSRRRSSSKEILHVLPVAAAAHETAATSETSEDEEDVVGITGHDDGYKCDRCDYETVSFKALFAHRLKNHSLAQKKDIGCMYCCKKFPTSDKLVAHIKRQHILTSKRKPLYSCSNCNFATTTKCIYTAHCNSHVTNVSKNLEHSEQPSNSVAATKSANLQMNGRACNNNKVQSASFHCDFCHFVTNIQSSMDIHVNQAHNMSNFICQMNEAKMEDPTTPNYSPSASSAKSHGSLSSKDFLQLCGGSAAIDSIVQQHNCFSAQKTIKEESQNKSSGRFLGTSSSNLINNNGSAVRLTSAGDPLLQFMPNYSDNSNIITTVNGHMEVDSAAQQQRYFSSTTSIPSCNYANSGSETPVVRSTDFMSNHLTASFDVFSSANNDHNTFQPQLNLSTQNTPPTQQQSCEAPLPPQQKFPPNNNTFALRHRLLFSGGEAVKNPPELENVVELLQQANLNLLELCRKKDRQMSELRTNVLQLLRLMFGDQNQVLNVDQVDEFVKEVLCKLLS